METDVGFVCARCDTFSPLGTNACPSCEAELSFPNAGAPAAAPAAGPVVPGLPGLPGMPGAPGPSAPPARPVETIVPTVGPIQIPAGFVLTEALMEQARSYICKKCYTPVPPGHKFCGRCGEVVPREVLTAQTLLISNLLEPGKAKLMVIKGEGFSTDAGDETAFLLGGRQHPAG